MLKICGVKCYARIMAIHEKEEFSCWFSTNTNFSVLTLKTMIAVRDLKCETSFRFFLSNSNYERKFEIWKFAKF